MSAEFRVTMVATREHYEADGSVVQPGTVRPADANVPLGQGWRYQVEVVDTTPPAESEPESKPEDTPTGETPSSDAPKPESDVTDPPTAGPTRQKPGARRAP